MNDPRADQVAPPNWMAKGDQVRLILFLCPRCSGAFEWRIGVLPYPIRCMSCGYGGVRWIPDEFDRQGQSVHDTRSAGWPWVLKQRAARDLRMAVA